MASYATNEDLTSLNTLLGSYATSADLTTALASYAKSADFSDGINYVELASGQELTFEPHSLYLAFCINNTTSDLAKMTINGGTKNGQEVYFAVVFTGNNQNSYLVIGQQVDSNGNG